MGVFPHGWCTMQNTIQKWMMYPGYPPFYLRINISSFRDALTMPPIACDLLGLRVDRFFADALLKKLDGWEDRKLPLGCQSNHSFGHQPLVNNLSRKLGLYIPFIPFHGAMHAYFQPGILGHIWVNFRFNLAAANSGDPGAISWQYLRTWWGGRSRDFQ